MLSTRLLAAAALVTLGVAACGGGTSPAPSGSAPTIGVAGGHLGTAAVTIAANDQNKFDPETQTVTLGDIVEWKNVGKIAHNIVFNADASIGDPVLAGGGVWQVKFTKVGSYPYSCTIHIGMVGTIVVTAG